MTVDISIGITLICLRISFKFKKRNLWHNNFWKPNLKRIRGNVSNVNLPKEYASERVSYYYY